MYIRRGGNQGKGRKGRRLCGWRRRSKRKQRVKGHSFTVGTWIQCIEVQTQFFYFFKAWDVIRHHNTWQFKVLLIGLWFLKHAYYEGIDVSNTPTMKKPILRGYTLFGSDHVVSHFAFRCIQCSVCLPFSHQDGETKPSALATFPYYPRVTVTSRDLKAECLHIPLLCHYFKSVYLIVDVM